MAKKLYLVRAQSNDGGKSVAMASQMAGLTFTSLVAGVDALPWSEISYVPCAVIDVDGKIFKLHSDRDSGFNIANLTIDWNAAPDTTPVSQLKPKAKIITKNGGGAPETQFTSAQAITVRAEIWTSDMAALTNYGGTSFVPFFDASGREHYVKLVFTAGVAETTIAAGKVPPGKYRATKASSTIADVIEHEIIVAY